MTTVEGRLFHLLEMVNDWLKYAEAKNGGLVAISGLATSAIVSYGSNLTHPSAWDIGSLTVAAGCFIASVAVGVLSFLPKSDSVSIQARMGASPDESDSLYFFGHLSRLTASELVRRVCRLDGENAVCTPEQRSERDLAGQIIINSRITQDKLRRFTTGARFFLAGLGVAVVSLAISKLL